MLTVVYLLWEVLLVANIVANILNVQTTQQFADICSAVSS